ncbi:unnamed protein product, partial [marine sediment metagenome]
GKKARERVIKEFQHEIREKKLVEAIRDVTSMK